MIKVSISGKVTVGAMSMMKNDRGLNNRFLMMTGEKSDIISFPSLM